MLTTNEVAAMLGVTTRRVRQMIVAGDMEAVRAGRDFFVPKSEAEKAKARKTKPGPAPAKRAGK